MLQTMHSADKRLNKHSLDNSMVTPQKSSTSYIMTGRKDDKSFSLNLQQVKCGTNQNSMMDVSQITSYTKRESEIEHPNGADNCITLRENANLAPPLSHRPSTKTSTSNNVYAYNQTTIKK